jgi:hypothetical protein
MNKNASYKEKFAYLRDWMPMIIDSIKRDLKNEHLKKDFLFVKQFFASKNLNKISSEEWVNAYSQAIEKEENGEALGEFITSRWLLKHTEIYDFFEQELSQLTSDFTELEQLDMPTSLKLMQASVQQFGAPSTYVFAVLNSVVFPDEAFQKLGEQARQEVQENEAHQIMLNEKMTIEKMQRSFEQEIARLNDKYEKKLSGLQKKYLIDVENLKKQVAVLQRQLQKSI